MGEPENHAELVGALQPVPRSVVEPEPASLLRRLAAILYDGLLIIAVLMIATIPFMPFLNGRVLVPQEVGWLAYVYRVWLVFVTGVFFGFFWTRRGQTIGMQAWRLRIEDECGQLLSWSRAMRHLAYAALPWLPSLLLLSLAEQFHSIALKWSGIALLLLGLISLAGVWFAHGRTWHDRRAGTRVVMLAKK